MTSPRRLLDEARTRSEEVIARAASVPPHPLRPDGWDEVMTRALTRSPGAARLVPAFLLSFLLGAGLVIAFRPATPTPAAPTNVAYASPGSRWSALAPDEVSLQSGRLFVTRPSGATLRIRTPDAVLDVSRSRFLAEVVTGGTMVQVEEGEVVLRSGNVTRTVKAGESLTWPPAPAIPKQLLEAPRLSTSGCESPEPARRECLRREAVGESLQAQAALFELGSVEAGRGDLDASLRTWRESLERFPEGVLHPEVRLAVFIELVRARRFSEARAAAQDFEAHCAGDPRSGDVEALRRQLP